MKRVQGIDRDISKERVIGKFILILIMIAVYYINKPTETERAIKNGTKTLTCEFSDGYRDIPKDKFVGYDDESGYWLFTNGQAKNCEIR